MMGISEPVFTKEDIEILEKIDGKELNKMINFMRDYKVVMWRNNDTGELMREDEMSHRFHKQPFPEYPHELLEIGKYFSDIALNGRVLLQDLGFFTKDSLASLMVGTLFSPNLICSFFADAYARDCFCDGLLGYGVGNNLYLKMLLHLQDCKRYYEYSLRNRSE